MIVQTVNYQKTLKLDFLSLRSIISQRQRFWLRGFAEIPVSISIKSSRNILEDEWNPKPQQPNAGYFLRLILAYTVFLNMAAYVNKNHCSDIKKASTEI